MAAAVAAMAMFGTVAQADVVTFNDLPTMFFSGSSTFTDGGYQFAYTAGPSGFAQIAAPAPCGPPCASNGTNAFYSFNTGSLTVSAIDGNPIALSALDLAQTFTTLNRPLDVMIVGQTVSSSTVSQEFTAPPGGADSFQTFHLPTGFTDLASFTISGVGTYPTTEFAVDNLVVSGAPGPSPGAGLLSLGLLILAGAMTKARGLLAR
jgi:hypothetical protein